MSSDPSPLGDGPDRRDLDASAGRGELRAFTPDGRKAYVANVRDGTLSVIDVARGEVVGTILDVPGAIVLGMAPGGEKLYVPQGMAHRYAVVDTRTGWEHLWQGVSSRPEQSLRERSGKIALTRATRPCIKKLP